MKQPELLFLLVGLALIEGSMPMNAAKNSKIISIAFRQMARILDGEFNFFNLYLIVLKT
jgi:hypothetical protein